jgi:hypothetical protein
MQLRTQARDCLYLNWALPKTAGPELPHPLRYEVHSWQDDEWIFASALLFRVSGLHPAGLPFPRLSYPQMNLRFYVFDDENVPSVLFLRTLVPFWVAPVSRYLGRQPATTASFSYPDSPGQEGHEVWTWTIEQRRRLDVMAQLASPQTGHGPSLGSWEQTVNSFCHRRRGYAISGERLRTIRTTHPVSQTLPLRAELGEVSLLADCLGGVPEELWHQPHSAWLCPEIPFVFELGKLIRLPLAPSAVIPATEGCYEPGSPLDL